MDNNLNTFRVLFMVKGILTLLFSLFFLFYMAIGSIVSDIPESAYGPQAPPFNPGKIFIVIGLFGFVITVAMGTLTLFASKYLNERRKYNFIFAMAIVNCLTGLLGILLCIFTLIELTKPHVKEVFSER